GEMRASIDEAETISRTLLLAQRTADTAVADAQAEADRILAAARADATAQLDSARVDAGQIVEDAEVEGRRAGESERVRVEGKVQALLARRDFLESDVDHLEQYLVAQRERITEAVSELSALVGRIPNGLADMRRPLLSAAADDERPPHEGDDDDTDPGSETAEITRIGEDADADAGVSAGVDLTGDVWAQRDDDPDGDGPSFDDDDERGAAHRREL
ncbi:MAG: DivIVA domain-containing protein, partial [Actinomycetota bacterium]|nr:DivIVA domain-containing protein [Actinomycetota bacterium]